MSIQVLEFEYHVENPVTIPVDRGHFGVTGSGDLEVLLEKKELNGAVTFKVNTPVVGFNDVWQKVLERFVVENGIGNVNIEINDDGATPVVVLLRLSQALAEVNEPDSE